MRDTTYSVYKIDKINFVPVSYKNRKAIYVDVESSSGYDFPEDFVDVIRYELNELSKRQYRSTKNNFYLEMYSSLLLHVVSSKLIKKSEFGVHQTAIYRVKLDVEVKRLMFRTLDAARVFA